MDPQAKHLDHEHNSMNVFMAGIAGIIAGAAGVTALALSDKDIRKKVGRRAQELRLTLQDWSAEKLHMVDHHRAKAEDAVEKIKVTEERKEEAMRN